LKNKKILKFQIMATIFSIILGTVLHFTYKWSGNNNIVAIFSSINESTWEHLKLAFFPMLIVLIVGYIKFGRKYIISQTLGIIVALIFITTVFFTYTGIIGKDIPIINILIFIIGVILGEFIAYKYMIIKERNSYEKLDKISIIIIVILLIFFIIFTYKPIKINLFMDPVTNSYGINEKK